MDEVYQEPDPSEPPYLNLEYRTKEALASAVADRGSYTWRYTDEDGEEKETAVDGAFILESNVFNDIRLKEKTDVLLYFSERPEKVSVLRYDPVPAKQETEASEEKETTETEENHETEEQGETVEVFRSKRMTKGKNSLY